MIEWLRTLAELATAAYALRWFLLRTLKLVRAVGEKLSGRYPLVLLSLVITLLLEQTLTSSAQYITPTHSTATRLVTGFTRPIASRQTTFVWPIIVVVVAAPIVEKIGPWLRARFRGRQTFPKQTWSI
jgi:hypothetical protein